MDARIQKQKRGRICGASTDDLPETLEPCETTKTVETDLPDEFVQKLFDFQITGIQFGINKTGRILLGDEMGVGKTV